MVEKKSKTRAKRRKDVIISYKVYKKKYLPKRYAREERLESIPKSMHR